MTGRNGFESSMDSYNFFEQEVADGCGLNGSLKADENRDGMVSFDELYKFVKANVKLPNVNVYGNGNTVDFY